MPIYEYDCAECGTVIEKIEFHAESPPLCCKHEMCKIISRPGLPVLKGTGFYETEYGNQPQHLKSTDQAIRAARECKEHKLVPARPRPTTSAQRKHILNIEKYGG